jgi:hypothetical protein
MPKKLCNMLAKPEIGSTKRYYWERTVVFLQLAVPLTTTSVWRDKESRRPPRAEIQMYLLRAMRSYAKRTYWPVVFAKVLVPMTPQ